LQHELTGRYVGHPAANDCLGALLATTLGFWYFMFLPSEAVASFVASPPSPAPAGVQRQNGLWSARLPLVPLGRAVGTSIACHGRPAPNAPVPDSVPVESIRSVWASVPVHARPAPIAMAFVGPVLVHSPRPIRASASVYARSAMSASGFHHSLLSLLLCGRTPCPLRPSLQYSSPHPKSFTTSRKFSRPPPDFSCPMSPRANPPRPNPSFGNAADAMK